MKVLIAICIALSIFLPIEAQHLSNKYVAYVVSEAYNKQVACMAKNIYYEAAKEPHEGKLAVAQVTMNRANNKDYPSDFCGVVYQKTNGTCQFSWVCEKSYPIHDEYAWEEAMYIAKRAMTEPILHKELAKTNAEYYHAVYVHPGWKNTKVVKKIGNHIFYTKV